MVGILTKRVKDPKKRNYIVIAFDIAVIIVFVWFTINQRNEYVNGYQTCLKEVCDRYTLKFCETFDKYKNMTPEEFYAINHTGTELPYLSINQSGMVFCNDTGCFT
jgi:hypothetical protein